MIKISDKPQVGLRGSRDSRRIQDDGLDSLAGWTCPRCAADELRECPADDPATVHLHCQGCGVYVRTVAAAEPEATGS